MTEQARRPPEWAAEPDQYADEPATDGDDGRPASPFGREPEIAAPRLVALAWAPPDTAPRLALSADPAASLESTRSFAFDRLSPITAVVDHDGVIVDTNEAWRLFGVLNHGLDAATEPGASYFDVCDRAADAGDPASAAVAEGLRRIVRGELDHLDVEYRCPSPSEDRWFLLQASAAPVLGRTGAVVRHVDITAAKRREMYATPTDGLDRLTGLPGRGAAVDHVAACLGRARDDGDVWVLFVDIDGFAHVNDRFGHRVGDELLVRVVSRLDHLRRDEDQLFRVGGDEFVVVGPSLTPAEALSLEGQVRSSLGEPFQIGAEDVSVTVSVGLAASRVASTVDSLLTAADSQLYLDKGRRRHRLGRRPRDPNERRGPDAAPSLVWQDTDPGPFGRPSS